MYGFDPLYMANEGRIVAIVSSESADAALQALRSHPLGAHAQRIGTVTGLRPDQSRTTGRVVLRTAIGGSRILRRLTGDQLPRIC
jgi:hydrogenase expression/formation protein HypE